MGLAFAATALLGGPVPRYITTMQATASHVFRHTTLTKCPDKVAGVTLLDEEPGYTGIYIRDRDGGLWPARTVDRSLSEHHDAVCAAWLDRPGSEDRRSQQS